MNINVTVSSSSSPAASSSTSNLSPAARSLAQSRVVQLTPEDIIAHAQPPQPSAPLPPAIDITAPVRKKLENPALKQAATSEDFMTAAKSHATKLRDEAAEARKKPEMENTKEKVNLLILGAAIVGLVVCIALIGTGIGALAGASGLLVGLGLLGMFAGAPLLATFSIPKIKEHIGAIPRFISTKQQLNEAKQTERTYNEQLETMEHPAYRNFVVELAMRTRISEKEIAISPNAAQGFRKWQAVHDQYNDKYKAKIENKNVEIIWNEDKNVFQEKATLQAEIEETLNKIVLKTQVDLLILSLKEKTKSTSPQSQQEVAKMNHRLGELRDEIKKKIDELTTDNQDSSEYEELYNSIDQAISTVEKYANKIKAGKEKGADIASADSPSEPSEEDEDQPLL